MEDHLSHLARYSRKSKVLTVTELTSRVKSLLEDTLWACWVVGEVSTVRWNTKGHAYFILKDEQAQLACVLFKDDLEKQKATLVEGMQVAVLGKLNVYRGQGAYQMIVQFFVQEGISFRKKALLALKSKLQEEGLFAQSNKYPLPTFIKKIGIITSLQGAAIRDFIKILQRRGFAGEVIVFHSLVQGSEAPQEIQEMLKAASGIKDLDVIVLSRGGGSGEDLWAFNDEGVVRELANCPVPTICAVGHEIDHTLSDLVACVRAETPSAAAEIILFQCQKQIHLFTENIQEFLDSFQTIIGDFHRELQDKCHRLSAENLLAKMQIRKENYNQRVTHLFSRFFYHFNFYSLQLELLYKQLCQVWPAYIAFKTNQLQICSLKLHSIDPLTPLKQGFASVSRFNGKAITSKTQLNLKDALSLRFQDGSVKVIVEEL